MNQDYDLVFLLAERSMNELLEVLLPRIIPETVTFKCIHHEGKQDLEKSIPRKLKAWKTAGRFVIIRDQDSGDCVEIKNNLKNLYFVLYFYILNILSTYFLIFPLDYL